MKNRVVIYARVSTDGQTVEHQVNELTAHAIRREWTIEHVYTETGSGMRASRPALEAMLARCRSGNVDTVLCSKLDRLGRSLIHLAHIIAEFDRLHVALVCPGQGIDTTGANPAARFQLQILGAVAEFERALIVERTRAGIATARAKGKIGGRRPLDPALAIEAQRLRAAGLSVRAIADRLEVSTGSAFKLLRAAPIEGYGILPPVA